MDRSSLSRREYITQPLRGLGTAFASRGSPASVPEEKARVPTSRVLLESRDLRLVPASHARPPAPYVPAILFVIRAELLAQRRLFIQQDKQMHAKGNGCHRRDHSRVRVSENNPQPDPSDCEAHVHRAAHVAGARLEWAWVIVRLPSQILCIQNGEPHVFRRCHPIAGVAGY